MAIFSCQLLSVTWRLFVAGDFHLEIGSSNIQVRVDILPSRKDPNGALSAKSKQNQTPIVLPSLAENLCLKRLCGAALTLEGPGSHLAEFQQVNDRAKKALFLVEDSQSEAAFIHGFVDLIVKLQGWATSIVNTSQTQFLHNIWSF